ncbi:MAG: hypothetical protein WDZ45_07565 [Flavobacteriaceae bacterium]
MNVHKIRLIDNTYDLLIADELLKKFIAAKIAFIENRIKETDATHKGEINELKSRIKDLIAESRSLDLFFEEHDGENVEMEIGCTIVMSVKDNESKQLIS